MNIEKITQGKNLTDTERTVLEYILDHLDTVQTEGVRGVARANYTSTSTIMRLARKMNYSGSLMGTDNDYEWVKTKISSSGNSYTKIVKNPIKQVNRQVYLLAQFLKYYGVDVWVEGYTFFVQGNSPVDCKQVLESAQDINHVIHNGANRNLTNAKVQEIQKLLS